MNDAKKLRIFELFKEIKKKIKFFPQFYFGVKEARTNKFELKAQFSQNNPKINQIELKKRKTGKFISIFYALLSLFDFNFFKIWKRKS